jgi:hypothetical protein
MLIVLKKRLKYCCTKNWHHKIYNVSRYHHYSYFKSLLNLERYLLIEIPVKYDRKEQQEKVRSITAAPHYPATRTSGKEPRRTQNKNRTGCKAEHGQDIHLNDNPKGTTATDKKIKENK